MWQLCLAYYLLFTCPHSSTYYVERYPFVGILRNGNTVFMDNLLSKIGRQCLYVDENFNPQETLKKINLLIIPTGGLWGTSKSEYFKASLERFLNSGGNILCFAQQDFLDFQAIPVPAGASLQAVGWRNSQSCYHGSIYFSQSGPIFSGQTSQRISAGVDGGFSSFPAGTSVLIRRMTNQEPALIAYRYLPKKSACSNPSQLRVLFILLSPETTFK